MTEAKMNLVESILSKLFPPELPPNASTGHVCVSFSGGHEDIPESGVLWRAYDVRQDGIEKHFAGRA